MTRRRMFAAVAGGMVLVAGLSLAAYHYSTNYVPFDAAVWRASEKGHAGKRKAMVRDLLKAHPLTGMKRAEVERMLGVPAWKDDDFYAYEMGPANGVISMDYWFLAVTFEDDVVVRAYPFRD